MAEVREFLVEVQLADFKIAYKKKNNEDPLGPLGELFACQLYCNMVAKSVLKKYLFGIWFLETE